MKKLVAALIIFSCSAGCISSGRVPLKLPDYLKGTGIRLVTNEGEPVKFIRADISVASESTGLPDVMVTVTASDRNGFIPVSVTKGAKYRISIKPGEYYMDELKAETGTVTMPLEQGVNDIILKKPLKKEITIRVRDFDTKEPIMNAKITETRSFGTEYSKQGGVDRGIGLTGKEGDFYTDEFNPDHVSRFGVMADGYHEEWLDIDSFQPGGSYEFELKKKSDF